MERMDATPTSSQPTPTATELLDVCLDLAKDAADLIVLQRDFLAKHGSVAQVTSTKTCLLYTSDAADE